jgi:hypothetical protein
MVLLRPFQSKVMRVIQTDEVTTIKNEPICEGLTGGGYFVPSLLFSSCDNLPQGSDRPVRLA